VERCAKLGITINALSSKTLADSVKMYERREEFQYTVLPALNQMLMKCMHLAQYFCTGSVLGPAEFRHYALSVDLWVISLVFSVDHPNESFVLYSYTHFTSPIRRYPDVIVHRLLAASLNYSDDPGYSVEDLKRISERANQTKACAKLCSETSGDIFFGALVRVCDCGTKIFIPVWLQESGNFEAIGVVMSLFDECFDFLLLKYAIVKRVYLKVCLTSQYYAL
jgi:DIS3-like exonuclease 2